MLPFSQPDFPLTWDFCAAIIKCFLISVYACAPLVCFLMSTAGSPVSQPVSQSTSQSPSTEHIPPRSILPLGYPSIQTGNQAVIHPASSHKYLLCFQVATVENIRREKKRNNNKNYKMLLLHYLWVAISLAHTHLPLSHYPLFQLPSTLSPRFSLCSLKFAMCVSLCVFVWVCLCSFHWFSPSACLCVCVPN